MTQERNTSTLTQLRAWYEANPAGCRFDAASVTNRAEFTTWQAEARARLRALLGFEELEETRCPTEAEVVERIEEEHYTGERLLVRVQQDMWVPAWMLVPKSTGPHPTVLCLHGHGMSKDVVIGRPRAEEEQGLIDFHRGDYGRRFAEAGYAVFCPDARGFGERDEGQGCAHIGQNALAVGQVLTGLRLWDHLRCFEYVLSRPEVDADRVGAAGLSMGCEHSMYLAALDERVRFSILSCCLRDLRDEVHESCHCRCSYIPDLFRWFDWTDIVCMSAPRPVLIQQGLQDYIPMPLVESALIKVRRAYGLTDAEGLVGSDFFTGGHEFNFTGALNWLSVVGVSP